MLEEIIKEGESLKTQDSELPLGGKINFDAFNIWSTSAILYLEQYYPNSVVTEKMKTIYKVYKYDDYNEFYDLLLQSLKAIRKIENEQIDFI